MYNCTLCGQSYEGYAQNYIGDNPICPFCAERLSSQYNKNTKHMLYWARFITGYTILYFLWHVFLYIKIGHASKIFSELVQVPFAIYALASFPWGWRAMKRLSINRQAPEWFLAVQHVPVLMLVAKIIEFWVAFFLGLIVFPVQYKKDKEDLKKAIISQENIVYSFVDIVKKLRKKNAHAKYGWITAVLTIEHLNDINRELNRFSNSMRR
ncbi:hypothetical protein ACAG39_02100 [Caldicellulosiruptoraceae bacterium PP1]